MSNFERYKHYTQRKSANIEEVKADALLRIADSLEVIQRPKQDLIDEINNLKELNSRIELANESWKERAVELLKEVELQEKYSEEN